MSVWTWIGGVGLTLSLLAMAGWVFVWPTAVGTDGDGPIVRVGTLATFGVFGVSLTLLLVGRAAKLRPGQSIEPLWRGRR